MAITLPIAKYRDEDNTYNIISVISEGNLTSRFRFYPEDDGVMIVASELDEYDGPAIKLNWQEWTMIKKLVEGKEVKI